MVRARNSNPTASAHPMSLLSMFQPKRSFHALHLGPMTIAMPVLELASEKAATSWTSCVVGMLLPMDDLESSEVHQSRSAGRFLGGVRGR